MNLRAVLDKLFADEAAGMNLDLRPVRRLVASLVQKCGRHDRHGELPPKKSDACARGGKGGCFYCRYGYPKKGFHGRSGERKVRLRKGDREGSWEAVFPRNDPLCTTFEPHVLLANMGNIDWRPCLNLWAVVEYICKYATKAPEGSRTACFSPGRVNVPAPAAPKEECGWRAHSHLFARAEGRLAQTEVGRRQDVPGPEGM